MEIAQFRHFIFGGTHLIEDMVISFFLSLILKRKKKSRNVIIGKFVGISQDLGWVFSIYAQIPLA